VSKINISLLIIGNLGHAGKISLHSIARLKPRRICYVADNTGDKWIKSNIKVQEIKNTELCRHEVPSTIYKSLGIKELINHRLFGSEDFIRITPLKWWIIHSSIAKHSDVELVIFSDLDVIWLKPIHSNFNLKKKVAVQRDYYPHTSKKYFCTGIMYWPASISNIELSLKLFKYQKQKIMEGNLIPDEPAFNNYITQEKIIDKIIPLSKDLFLIGHRIRKLLTSENFILKQAFAYHANYFVGDFQKTIVLKSVKSKQDTGVFWLLGLAAIYALKITSKFKLYMINILKYRFF
jgi:hypothetical protein